MAYIDNQTITVDAILTKKGRELLAQNGNLNITSFALSDDEIDYPKVVDPDILVVMSQEAFNTYADTVKPDGTLLLDPDMVPKHELKDKMRVFQIPSTKIAEELGKTIVANVVMLGALVAVTDVTTDEAFKNSLLSNIPKGTEKLNLTAFEKGYEYGKKLLEATSKN